MNWLPLKLHNIPLIDKQIHTIQPLIRKIKQQIQNGDILAVQTLSELNSSIRQRIEHIDKFYNKHCLDPRVRYLYGAKIILDKIIQSGFQGLERYEPYYEELPWKNKKNQRQSQEKFQRKVEPKKLVNENNTKANEKTLRESKERQIKESKERERQKEKIVNKQIKSHVRFYQGSDEKKIRQNAEKVTPIKSSRKIQKLAAFKAANETNLNKSSASPILIKDQKIQDRINKKETKNIGNQTIQGSLKNLSQLVFTIKMTKEEYNTFLKMKKQAQRL